MSNIKDHLEKILRNGRQTITRAVLWKIDRTEEDTLSLKFGRYKKPKEFSGVEQLEKETPKSELTLNSEELNKLIEFLKDNYAPFKEGVKAFIPIENPSQTENAEQIKKLFSLPEKKGLIEFILDNEIIPEDLALGL